MNTNQTELEQAVEARKEAQEYHQEVKCMLQQARNLHDSTLTNQRKITYALTSLMPQSKVFIGVDLASDSDKHAEQVHEVAKQVADRDIHAVVHSMMVLAMSNQDVIHIWVGFQGHVNNIDVDVRRAPWNKDDESLLYESVRLDPEYPEFAGDPLTNLLAIEDKLIDLISEARDNAEVAA